MSRVEVCREAPFSVAVALLILVVMPSAAVAGPGYALERVAVVSGGHPVREVESGVIFERTAGSGCSQHEPGLKALPLAATFSTEIGLAVSVVGCDTSVEPSVQCSYVVEPRESQEPGCRETKGELSSGTSWQGWEGKVALAIPEATGAYQFSLTCRIEAAGSEVEEEISGALYATYAAPLVPFSPPETDWYERAACLGAGLGAGDSESDALKAILGALFSYGGENWRYGFANPAGHGILHFRLLDDAAGAIVDYQIDETDPQVKCIYEDDSDPFCNCTWQALAALEKGCNFADCYVFSHVFQAMAAVMGIGGLRPDRIDEGFVTNPSESLDPLFMGNVLCESVRDVCYPYLFSSHSLRLRDNLYYDATFNGIYNKKTEPVAYFFKAPENGALTFHDTDLRLHLLEEAYYGFWPYYFDSELVGVIEPVSRAPAKTVKSPVKFTGDVDFFVTDGRLRADVEVKIRAKGEYIFHGHLSKNGVTISSRPASDTPLPTTDRVAGKRGKYIVQLYFSGDDIFRSELGGPYELYVFTIVNNRQIVSLRVATEEEYGHEDFGETAGRLHRLAKGTGRTRGSRSIPVSLEIEVDKVDVYALGARLSQNGSTIAYTGQKGLKLDPGTHPFHLEFPEELIPKSGLTGPYEVTAVLYDSELRATHSAHEKIEMSTADDSD